MKGFLSLMSSISVLMLVLSVRDASIYSMPISSSQQNISASYKRNESTLKPEDSLVTVSRVIDGDTIVIEMDGTKSRIRMIGVNTPESASPDESKNTEEGKIASEYTKNALPEGTKVFLEFGDKWYDQYGRLLAYVWLDEKCDRTNYQDFLTYNYGAQLLQNTYCEAVYYAPNEKYRVWYEQLESEFQQKTGI